MSDLPPAPPARRVFRFAGFILDLSRGALLTAAGAELPLRPRSLALLGYLVERPGQLVSRGELMAALWPELHVVEDSVAQCVHDIRHALGDAGQRLVRTVPRRARRRTARWSWCGPSPRSATATCRAASPTASAPTWRPT
jgi:DNA-binding winged helix-turn-helix (wHTH) protein